VGAIVLRQRVDAPVAAVWEELAAIDRHVQWMADADSITFTGDRHRGVGTTFDCVTRVGPLRTVDRMEVTRWDDGVALGVRHVGLVRGEGVFTLHPNGDATVVEWSERLRFRWYLGGPVAGWLAGPLLRIIWQGNLRRFAARVS
jgi:carbon monoxide dehydrogenase subunit G